jgi:hypothetical protein
LRIKGREWDVNRWRHWGGLLNSWILNRDVNKGRGKEKKKEKPPKQKKKR